MNYQGTVALDFELFNTKHYWSICWIGAIETDEQFNYNGAFDQILNPIVKEKFVGHTMTLPFNYSDIKGNPTFKEVSSRLFSLVDGALVIGHAIENDVKMLADACKRFNAPMPHFYFLDSNVCYNAVKKTGTEHSLSALAEEFNIQFEAHNPVEDARAALEIVRLLSKGQLKNFLVENGIVAGEFKNGLIRRSYFKGMAEKPKQRILRYNAVFEAAERYGQGTGAAYFISNAITTEQDVSELCAAILKSGGRLCADSYTADITITNDLHLCPLTYKTISLRDLVRELRLKQKYDFTPKKVVDKNAKSISYTQYLTEIYSENMAMDGCLKGNTFCFTKELENSANFPTLAKAIFSCGGKLTARMESDCVFVVNSLKDFNHAFSDGRMIAFKRGGGNQKVVQLKELIATLQEYMV